MPFRKKLSSYLPTLISILLALLAVVISKHYQNREIVASLQFEQQALKQSFEKFEALHREHLSSLRRFFTGSNFVSRDEFKAFVEPILASFGSIQALEWIPQVTEENREFYQNLAIQDGLQQFKFKRWQPSVGWSAQSEAWARIYYPVFYIEPMAGNEAVLGIDLGSHQKRRKAIEKALESHAESSSSVIDLVQGGKGVLLFLTTHSDPSTEAQQRGGLVLAVFQLSKFLDAVFETHQDGMLAISMKEVDIDSASEFYNNSVKSHGDFNLKTDLQFINQRWQLSISPGPAFPLGEGFLPTWLVGLIGLIFITIMLKYNRLKISDDRRIQESVEDTDRDISIKSALLELNEERFRATFNVLPDAVITINEKGIIQEINPAAVTMFGYSSSEIQGKSVNNLMPESYSRVHDDYLRQYIKTRIPHIIGSGREVVAQRRNGETFPAQLDVSEYQIGENMMFVGVLQDLTAEKKLYAEQDLINRYLQSILDATGEGICRVNQRGVIQFSNESAELMLGRSAEDLVGEKFNHYVVAYQDPSQTGIVTEALDIEEMQAVSRVILASHDGRHFTVEISINSLLDVQGKEDGAVIVFRDISVQEQAEKKIEVQHRELESANQELERLNKDLEQFAYIASHDLRAPLRAIKNLALWIEEDIGDALQGDTRQNMTLLQNRVDRLDRLLADLLAYSRAGRSGQAYEDFNSLMIVQAVIDLHEIKTGLTVKVSDELPVLHSIRAGFEIVIRNLIGNAIKHHDKDSGTIEISVVDEADTYIFSVKDDGPGILEENRERAFDLFVTLNSRDEVEGSGMGLSICRRAIDQMGGDIWIDSNYTSGACFKFSIPKMAASSNH